ncbi:MAG: PEP-CTERM sorting domain-containing protein [Planctomycetes bacterium]|nr:PEP-CTERM sorting domain-containing protein [Planctomycetota bacterium]
MGHTGAFGVEIVNNTGATRQTADISYIGEFWRSSTSTSGTPNTLTFGYSVGAPGSTTYLSGAASGLASLNLVGPAPVAVNGPLDGDLPANQVANSGTLTNLNWQVGQSLYLRWQDFNDQGNDAGLAVDNVRVEIPEPTSVVGLLLAGVGLIGIIRRRVA